MTVVQERSQMRHRPAGSFLSAAEQPPLQVCDTHTYDHHPFSHIDSIWLSLIFITRTCSDITLRYTSRPPLCQLEVARAAEYKFGFFLNVSMCQIRVRTNRERPWLCDSSRRFASQKWHLRHCQESSQPPTWNIEVRFETHDRYITRVDQRGYPYLVL
jgi:hypothetical protein